MPSLLPQLADGKLKSQNQHRRQRSNSITNNAIYLALIFMPQGIKE